MAFSPLAAIRAAQEEQRTHALKNKKKSERDVFNKRMKRIELRAVAAVKRIKASKAGSGSK